MFSILPDLTPRDSHSLWYASSRNPNQIPAHLDPSFLYSSTANNEHGLAAPAASGATPANGPGGRNHNAHNRSAAQAAIIERSILGRLRADELYMERRRQNVGNLGSTWLKPPGVAKTLFQICEEKREAEEHAEALRREMMQQELAEAEAAGGGAVDPMALGIDDTGAGGATGLGGEQIMVDDDEEEEEEEEENGEAERDLDDDIPDADEGGFGFDGISDEEEEEEEEEEESEEEEETGGIDNSPRRQRREEANRIGTMRATEDRMREMLATRGTASHRHHLGQASGGSDLYGADEEINEEDQADILEEDDLLQGGYDDDLGQGMEDDLDMDANLDDDIPEAESLGGYEHTDSEAELSSDEDKDEHEISYAGGSAQRRISQQPQQFGRNPAHRISSSGPYALPPYPPRQTPQQQQDYHHHRHHRQDRSSLASARDVGEGGGGGGGPRSSLDISGLLSRDGSSVIGSSPRMRRGH